MFLTHVQELLKMFNDSDSFFYSPTGDLTNTLQRQFSGKYNTADPLWNRVRKINCAICYFIAEILLLYYTPAYNSQVHVHLWVYM